METGPLALMLARNMSEGHQLDPESLGDHVDRLYRAAWSLCGSREEAEDLVQETFARVLSKPRFLRNDDDIGYLLRVLRNTFVSSRRAASRRPITDPLPDDLSLVEDRSAPRPEAQIEVTELYARSQRYPSSSATHSWPWTSSDSHTGTPPTHCACVRRR